MLTHLRIHLLLVVLSGTARMNLKIILLKKPPVIKASKNSNPQQTKCCGLPFLLWCGKGGKVAI